MSQSISQKDWTDGMIKKIQSIEGMTPHDAEHLRSGLEEIYRQRVRKGEIGEPKPSADAAGIEALGTKPSDPDIGSFGPPKKR